MNDQFWQSLRYILIGGGSFLAGRGKLDPSEVVPLAERIITVASGAVAIATAAWGLYVKFRTRAVPEKVAARADIPVVSSATGAIVS